MRFMPSATRASSRADRAPAVPVHAEPPAVVWERTGSRPGGLTPEEVAQRRTAAVRTERGNTSAVLGEIVESVVEPLQLLLVVVGVLSAIFGELRDAIAIFSVIVLVSAVEAISEVRAKRALQALRELSAPNALVRRAGVAVAVPVGALVVGDVLLVEAGSVVAADARVVEADGLATDESRLTGEPVAAAKGPEPVDADAPLAERSSVLHAGTAVVAGAGEGVVVALGDETEIGRLGRLVAQAKEPPTPLQGAMAELARAALIVAVTACVLVPLLGVLRGQPPREMLLDGLTLAFATIPEELPILVTVLVALGGLRMAQHGVLLRRLRAAEAVGAMTVLLADKTGTLTENRLLIERIDGDRERVLAAAAAAHGAAAAQDPVDRALVEAAGEPASSERLARYPFDPVRRRESAVWRDPGGAWVAVKGAPEAVLDACAMSETERASVLARVARLADDGLRIIAVAERRVACAPATPPTPRPSSTSSGWPPSAIRCAPVSAMPWPSSLTPACGRSSSAATTPRRSPRPRARPASALPRSCTAARRSTPSTTTSSPGGCAARPSSRARRPRTSCGSSGSSRIAARRSPSPATASTTRRPSPRRTSGSPWARAEPISPARRPTWCSSMTRTRRSSARSRAVAGWPPSCGARSPSTWARRSRSSWSSPCHSRLGCPPRSTRCTSSCWSCSWMSARRWPSSPSPRRRGRWIAPRAIPPAGSSTARSCPRSRSRPWRSPLRCSPRFSSSTPGRAAGMAIAAAVAGWLIANVAIAWSLRARPGLPLRRNVAFPMWALVALVAAFILSLTQAGAALGVEPLTAGALRITAGVAAVGVAVAAAGRVALSLSRRL